MSNLFQVPEWLVEAKVREVKEYLAFVAHMNELFEEKPQVGTTITIRLPKFPKE